MSHVHNSPNGLAPALGGLPPVAPPTAGFLVRLFVVPALIVAVGVGAAFLFHLSFGWLLGSPMTPEQYLARFDDPNWEVRWRAAADLSQRLPRDNRLASDPDFALGVVKRLQATRTDTRVAEADLALRYPPLSPDQIDKLSDAEWLKRQNDLDREAKKLNEQRLYIQMLTASLGHFMVPVGAPVLRDMALQESGAEASHLLQLRANALWSLAVLGENCGRFDDLTPVEQQIILDRLQTAAENDPDLADTARSARSYLQTRQQTAASPKPLTKQVPDAMGVDEVAAKCAADNDPFLRELSAFALNFWYGDAAENKKMEQTLDLLAHDDGRGTLTLEQRRAQARRTLKTDYPIKTISYSVPPELTIKLNATIALARRGSDLVSTGRLAEMLDENKLRSQFLTEDANTEKPKADEGTAAQIVVKALEAAHDLHAKRPEKITPELRAAVDGLKGNSNSAIKNAAAETALELGK
jgi:hypothetical protein